MIRTMALILLVIVVAGCDYFKKPGGEERGLWFDEVRVNQRGALGSSVSGENGISVGIGGLWTPEAVGSIVLEIQPPVDGKSKYAVDMDDPGSGNGVVRVGVDSGLAENTRYTVTVYTEEDGVRHSFSTWTFSTERRDRKAVDVNVGQVHACAILKDASLNCWGSNIFGELGVGGGPDYAVDPVQIITPPAWTSISVNASYSCGISADNSLWCWGRNLVGRLGTGGIDDSNIPAAVSLGKEWLEVDTGATHVCAIDISNKLWCWGGNSEGQLGVGNTDDSSVPVQVGVLSWKDVYTGVAHTCAIREDDTLWCWGGNAGGQLGDGSTRQSLEPLEVGFGVAWSKAAVGNQTSCGLTTDNEMLCWGKGQFSPSTPFSYYNVLWSEVLGDDFQISNDEAICENSLRECYGLFQRHYNSDFRPDRYSRIAESELFYPDSYDYQSSATKSDFNGKNYCVSTESSGVWCTAFSSGLRTESTIFPGMWDKVVTGLGHACGVKQDGSLWCWGANDYGQLGGGSIGSYVAEPTAVGNDLDWVDIFLSSESTCGLKSDGGLFCWGNNVFGQFGLGKGSIENSPVAVGAGQLWAEVSLMENKLCAINTTNELWCSGKLWSGDANLSSDKVLTEMISAWSYRGRYSMPYHPLEEYDVFQIENIWEPAPPFWAAGSVYATRSVTYELVKVENLGKVIAFTQPFQLLESGPTNVYVIGRELAHEVCVVLENGSVACVYNDPRRAVFSSCYHDEVNKLHCAISSGEEFEPMELIGTFSSGMNICNKSSSTDLPYCYSQKDISAGEWVSASVNQFYACGITASKQLSCEGLPATGYAKRSQYTPGNDIWRSDVALYSVRF